MRTARRNEKSAGLAKRTGTTWSPEELAVANGIGVNTALQEGPPLKVAILQAYTPRKHCETDSGFAFESGDDARRNRSG